MNQLLAMRIFLRIAQTGSFSQAASHLGVPRSSVSKQVNDLEKYLGIKLVHRTTRAVALTAEGMEYYAQSLRIISELDELDNAMSGKGCKPTGHLRIDAPAAFAVSLLIPKLPEFQHEYPDLTIAVGISDRTINILGEGVDCGIRAGEVQDQTLIGRKITEIPFVTCASPAYLSRKGKPNSPKDVEQHHDHAGYFFAATGKPEPLVFEKQGEKYTIDAARYSTNEGNGLTQLLLAGLGIGQHLRPCLQPYIESGALVEVLNEWTRPSIPFHAVYPPNRHKSARLKVFVDWLISTF
ncbi:LysR family transcriptional regulator [Pseudomonas eucalypticola]|uniref:LysR family transcriptional regulator n=1 Tax=Pseudomonas eucalypticola TaxID=2599595 RepID=A0A7D5H6E2_9PSED|nr:LysR family transcriptional regulator [Pseudomonas eucalypticola]QKZ04244.1 LysR family transcriptional regulator [Pseudomonas eucalypticola]